MCGRYGRRGSKQKIAESFGVGECSEEVQFEETFDAAPGSIQPVVRIGQDGRTLECMRWGFKLPDRLLFNTRSEAVTEAKFWKERVRQRCIVPVSMYFEWPSQAAKPKPKFEITVSGMEYFGIAGVYGPWKNPRTGEWEPTFSTFTTEPNNLVMKIHFRQPVILDSRDYEEWLDPSERFPSHLLRIHPEDQMQVSQAGQETPATNSKGRRSPVTLMRSLFE